MRRREFTLGLAFSLLADAVLTRQAIAQDAGAGEEAGAEARPFDFDILAEQARLRSREEYAPPPDTLPEQLEELTYDLHRLIRFDPDKSRWRGQSPFELQAFHLGWLFKEPVRIFTVADGQAVPMHFSGDDFIYQEPLIKEKYEGLDLPGVAGFRLHYPLNEPGRLDELIAFLGASYFRALGKGSRYGLSARGVALNTATSQQEEFPRFTEFYVEKPGANDATVTIHAALDGPSMAGAYRFVIAPGRTTRMEVTSRLFLRQDVDRLGIAPMTSMFMFSGVNRAAFDDYRKRVHDSEGLRIVRRNGDVLWRSLNNPTRLATSFFSEENPRSFGLFQRTRGFDEYLDAGARYELRPSLLVEPLGDWGRGSVCLVEIPTELEVNDNIVCFWVPDVPAQAGQEMEYQYRLTWGEIEEDGDLARVVNVSTGAGGVSGVEREDDGLRKFVIDYEGGNLGNLFADANVTAVVNANNGEIIHSAVSRLEGSDRWRLVVDLRLPKNEAVELNAHLAQRDMRLTETWLIQWRSGDERHP